MTKWYISLELNKEIVGTEERVDEIISKIEETFEAKGWEVNVVEYESEDECEED